MKKIILTLTIALIFTCLFIVGVNANDAEAETYYLVQDDASDFANTLKAEGKNVVGVANLYSNAVNPLFATASNGDNIVIKLAENINYVPSERTTAPDTTVAMKIEKAITVTVMFGDYSWWFADDIKYCGFVINNTGATLRLIGGKLDGEKAVEVEDDSSYSANTINNNIDLYGGYVGIYVSCGNVYAENLIAIGQEELIYRNNVIHNGAANYEFKNCSLNIKKASIYAIADKPGFSTKDVTLKIDGGYYEGIALSNMLESYVKNAKIGSGRNNINNTIVECSFYIDSWKGINEYNLVLDNVEVTRTYFAEGDSNLIVANNCTFNTINLKGDSSGGADAILTDSTYEEVIFTGNKGTGTLTVINSATCETAGTKTVYTKDASTPDAEYAAQNPALGHIIENPTRVQYDNYFVNGAYTGECKFCKQDAVETVPSAPAFVRTKGISCFTEGESFAVTQGFIINEDVVKYFGDDYDFGVFAHVNTETDAVSPQLGDKDTVSGSLKNGEFVVANIKIGGIPSDNLTTKLVFCMYVKLDDKLYYLNNGETSEAIVGLSYNDVLEITK